MAGLTRLRVKALTPSRRRGGVSFTREPRDLTAEDLGGENLDGLVKLLAILEDPQLSSVFVLADDTIEAVTVEKVEQLRGAVLAWRAAEADEVGKADVAALAAQLLGGDHTELQPASGGVGEAGGEASPPATSPALGGVPECDGASDNPAGTTSSSAEGVEQSRQAADVSAPDQKVDADEGNQPEGTPEPLVAEPNDEPPAKPAAAPRRGRQRSH